MKPDLMTIPVPFVDLTAQYATIAEEVHEAFARVLNKTDFILGEEMYRFEQEFAAYCNVEHGVGVDSGTSALEMALMAYRVGPGDEVITAANTFIATALAISYTGATPVLVDIDPQTYELNPDLLKAAITPRTKAIMPVHLYGHPADMEPIMEIAHQYGLIVIEDASQAHGARYKDKRVGSFGHAAAFSLYPGKNLGAYGDAGIIVTHDATIAETLRRLRNYGQTQKYHHVQRGYNRRLDTLQAALLRVKLRYLDDWNAARRRHAALYHQLLASAPMALPEVADEAEPVYHLYVIRTHRRDALQAHLQAHGIAVGIHYPIPIHLQPAYNDLGYQKGDFPITEQCANQILSLPMYPELTPDAIAHVTTIIHSALSKSDMSPVIHASV